MSRISSKALLKTVRSTEGCTHDENNSRFQSEHLYGIDISTFQAERLYGVVISDGQVIHLASHNDLPEFARLSAN